MYCTIHCCAKEVQASFLRGMILLSECFETLSSKYGLEVRMNYYSILTLLKKQASFYQKLMSGVTWNAFWLTYFGVKTSYFWKKALQKLKARVLATAGLKVYTANKIYSLVPSPLEDWFRLGWPAP